MNSKWHLYTSIAKSVIRICGCSVALATKDVFVLALALFVAEILGILEEIRDDR